MIAFKGVSHIQRIICEEAALHYVRKAALGNLEAGEKSRLTINRLKSASCAVIPMIKKLDVANLFKYLWNSDFNMTICAIIFHRKIIASSMNADKLEGLSESIDAACQSCRFFLPSLSPSSCWSMCSGGLKSHQAAACIRKTT